ncbi:transcriptional regulator/antitoxin, MazE [bacterium]|jgi:AbrB family looped-hinge helix DNA binding protein|nr:transcriptional regulator/antitoxin, MazE [bacterium]NBS52639.1 transcriptional regulator/antitoxin, MazE [Spartobacteria bacterium]
MLSTKGQVVLPSPIRRLDRLRGGESFDIERLDSGKYLLTLNSPPSNQGLVDLLASCPVKGWFEPIRSESTDTL